MIDTTMAKISAQVNMALCVTGCLGARFEDAERMLGSSAEDSESAALDMRLAVRDLKRATAMAAHSVPKLEAELNAALKATPALDTARVAAVLECATIAYYAQYLAQTFLHAAQGTPGATADTDLLADVEAHMNESMNYLCLAQNALARQMDKFKQEVKECT
ncbi:hypothetical protein [Selenomonas artemidis]|uniref:Uncharacterized protein n=1 Tax=Selenomonas artemidis F0399 TaxID=749551 RepID=E7N411_9FIRM|nr:hypothetical protein [Selenomonas artemidis]EFW29052.1 hypothetical protein HMPREF9555_01752 [Selenomonas artemidis F0399]